MTEQKHDNDGSNTLVCLRADRPAPIRSKLQHCQECGHEVWVSPASLAYVGADAHIVCTVCLDAFLEKLPPDEKLKLMPPSEGQMREIREAAKP